MAAVGDHAPLLRVNAKEGRVGLIVLGGKRQSRLEQPSRGSGIGRRVGAGRAIEQVVVFRRDQKIQAMRIRIRKRGARPQRRGLWILGTVVFAVVLIVLWG